ncbi:MAG: ankyrin repeat domain-containing protein [Longimicrobiales bacterium]
MSSSSERAFFSAVIQGDRARVEELVRADPGLLEAHDAEGRSGLLLAVYHGQHEVVNLLTDHRPRTDIFEAAASGRVDRVRDLVQEDASLVRRTSSDGFSPLGLAAFFGHPEVVEVLLEAGAEPDVASENTMRVTPLHSAAAHGESEVAHRICEMLLARGADPNPAQAGGWRPLHQAASHGNLPLVKLLVGHGADVAPRSDDGRTPLSMAREAGNGAVVSFLEDRVRG